MLRYVEAHESYTSLFNAFNLIQTILILSKDALVVTILEYLSAKQTPTPLLLATIEFSQFLLPNTLGLQLVVQVS